MFKVHAFPSRIITAAYAFLVLILTNTYTANLAAFLTVDQLDTQISDIIDLRGKAVVTIEPYIDRLYSNHRIVATDKEGAAACLLFFIFWWFQGMCPMCPRCIWLTANQWFPFEKLQVALVVPLTQNNMIRFMYLFPVVLCIWWHL